MGIFPKVRGEHKKIYLKFHHLENQTFEIFTSKKLVNPTTVSSSFIHLNENLVPAPVFFGIWWISFSRH